MLVGLLIWATSAAEPCPQDSLWRVLRSGRVLSGCSDAGDSLLVERSSGEPAGFFLRRAGNLLVASGRPAPGLDLLARARTAGGPRDSLLAESAEALLALGRLEQALGATWVDGSDRSEVLLRQRSRIFELAGLHDDAREARERADSLASIHGGIWRWEPRPSMAANLGLRSERNETWVDPLYRQRAIWAQGIVPDYGLGDDESDTALVSGDGASLFAMVSWGGSDSDWKLGGNGSVWGASSRTFDPDVLPWGLGVGFGLERRMSDRWRVGLDLGAQSDFVGPSREQDRWSTGVSATWNGKIVSMSIADVFQLSWSESGENKVPVNTVGWSASAKPARGPRWNLGGALSWVGQEDVESRSSVPSVVWRTRGVREGMAIWGEGGDPPAWTLLDPATGTAYDSAAMARMAYGLVRVPEPTEGETPLVERRPGSYWAPSISVGVAQALPWKLGIGFSVASGWRSWSEEQTVLVADPWTRIDMGRIPRIAVDESTGRRWLASDPAGGTFILLDDTRRRRDHWTTAGLSVTWAPMVWCSWLVQWSSTRTETNIADLDSAVAGRKSSWSIGASLFW